MATQIVREGGLIAYPTEAVFGLGCDPFDEDAVLRLLALKQRSVSKGLILVASDFNQLSEYLAPVDARAMARAQTRWPGPYTWVFPASEQLPPWIRGAYQSVAVRVSAHPVVVALCESLRGPLVSSSANRSGLQPARSLLAVKKQFAGDVDFYLDGPVNAQARPSEIRDVLTDRVIRPA